MRNKITDEQIRKAFEGTNFGDRDNKEVLISTLLKCACGYYSGFTATNIVKGLKLVHSKRWELTYSGKEFLYDSIEPLLKNPLPRI